MNKKPRQGYLFKRYKGKHLSIDDPTPARIYLSYEVQGQRYTIGLRTRDVREAQRKAAAFMGRVRWGDEKEYLQALVDMGEEAKRRLDVLMKVPDEDVRIREGWQAYLKSKRRPASGELTLEAYRGQWRRFAAWTQSHTLQEVGDREAERYVAALEEDLKAQTVDKHIKALSLIWRVLCRSHNPWAGLRSTKKSQVQGYRMLSVSECRRVWNNAEGEWKTLIMLGFCTGMRLRAAATLRWEEIDWERRVITPGKGKQRKTKRVGHPPLVEELAAELRRLHAKQGKPRDGAVLPELAGLYERDRSALSKRMGRIFQISGVKSTSEGKASFHSFRATWQTLNDEAGTNRVIARYALGHGSAQMSDTYSKVSEETAFKQVNAAIPSLAG